MTKVGGTASPYRVRRRAGRVDAWRPRPGTEGTAACNYSRACAVLRVDGEDVGRVLRRPPCAASSKRIGAAEREGPYGLASVDYHRATVHPWCPRTAQNAIRGAARDGLLVVQERRREGRRNDANVVRIISRE